MKITVIGTGYLGAVHAACMAEIGHDVLGVDVDEAKIAALATGRTPFFEPGLGDLLARTVNSGKLRYSTSLAETADFGDVHFICVGTRQHALASPVMATQYLDRVPDRVIQTGRNKLLYLVFRDGQTVETILGVPVLLTGDELRTYLEAHQRVWLVSDAGSYIQGVPADVRNQVSKDFRIVAQDAATTVSLWDAG